MDFGQLKESALAENEIDPDETGPPTDWTDMLTKLEALGYDI